MRKWAPASTAVEANSSPAGSIDFSADEGFGHILGAESTLCFYIVVSTPIVAASSSRQPRSLLGHTCSPFISSCLHLHLPGNPGRCHLLGLCHNSESRCASFFFPVSVGILALP